QSAIVRFKTASCNSAQTDITLPPNVDILICLHYLARTRLLTQQCQCTVPRGPMTCQGYILLPQQLHLLNHISRSFSALISLSSFFLYLF
ncbi:MAG: hypothetical protein U9Q17_00600, partial [Chloroflexota bacterium]|nr:hypothetical protein [Chloroflexota bacterium]